MISLLLAAFVMAEQAPAAPAPKMEGCQHHLKASVQAGHPHGAHRKDHAAMAACCAEGAKDCCKDGKGACCQKAAEASAKGGHDGHDH